MNVQFPTAAWDRRTRYDRTIELHRLGLLSLGFVWELAKHDEVFAAFLRKSKFEIMEPVE